MNIVLIYRTFRENIDTEKDFSDAAVPDGGGKAEKFPFSLLTTAFRYGIITSATGPGNRVIWRRKVLS